MLFTRITCNKAPDWCFSPEYLVLNSSWGLSLKCCSHRHPPSIQTDHCPVVKPYHCVHPPPPHTHTLHRCPLCPATYQDTIGPDNQLLIFCHCCPAVLTDVHCVQQVQMLHHSFIHKPWTSGLTSGQWSDTMRGLGVDTNWMVVLPVSQHLRSSSGRKHTVFILIQFCGDDLYLIFIFVCLFIYLFIFEHLLGFLIINVLISLYC